MGTRTSAWRPVANVSPCAISYFVPSVTGTLVGAGCDRTFPGWLEPSTVVMGLPLLSEIRRRNSGKEPRELVFDNLPQAKFVRPGGPRNRPSGGGRYAEPQATDCGRATRVSP